MIKNATVQTSLNSTKLPEKSKKYQKEINPSDATVDFLLAYSKALSVKTTKSLGEFFELQN